MIRPDGTQQRRVTRLAESGGYAAEPTWTSDSRSLVFSGSNGVDGQLLRVSLSTLAVDYATSGGPVLGRHPRWRPGTVS